MSAGRVRELAGGRIRFLGSFPEVVPPVELPEVAFAGRSNVGKSSAINRLLACGKAARVSGRPGRTQAINLFEVERRLVVADLPGYGFAKVPEAVSRRWKGLIEGYLADRETLRLVVVLVDPRRAPGGMDAEMIWGLRQSRLPLLVLATKIDKLKRSKRRAALAALREAYALEPSECLGFSSLSGEGFDAAWAHFDAAIASPEGRA